MSDLDEMMTNGEAIGLLIMMKRNASFWQCIAIDKAVEALVKMEAIQKVIDMPFEWEQDDRRRYTKIADIVRTVFTDEVE